MELLTSTGIAEQLRLAQAQKQRSDHLEDSLTLITSLLLVPTLIAGVFGANTHIPGEAS